MHFLSQMPFSKDLREHQLILLAASCKRYLVNKNTLISNQGDENTNVCIVISGMVKIVRKICFLPERCYYEFEEKDGSIRQL
jgi:hypothetical protein